MQIPSAHPVRKCVDVRWHVFRQRIVEPGLHDEHVSGFLEQPGARQHLEQAAKQAPVLGQNVQLLPQGFGIDGLAGPALPAQPLQG